jgi:hypothetical protein
MEFAVVVCKEVYAGETRCNAVGIAFEQSRRKVREDNSGRLPANIDKRGEDTTGVRLRNVKQYFRSVESVDEAVMKADQVVDKTGQLLGRQ